MAARTALAQAEEINESRLIIDALAWLTLIESDLGDEASAHAHAALAIRHADALREVQLQSECRRHLAHLHVQCEEWIEALALFDRCLTLLSGAEAASDLMLMGADHAESCLALGRLDEAANIAAETLAIARAATSRHFEAVARRVQGQLFAVQGAWGDAIQAFDEAIATLEETGSRLELGRALFQRGILRQTQNEVDSACADWTQARTLFENAGARPMLWRTHAALGQLAQVKNQAEEVENEFAAARAVVEELAAGINDESLREKLLQRAARLIPPARSLTPRQAVQRGFGGLTAREREVAALIAQGKTNRDIANALVLSERTVEGHVGNILGKLGFSTRTQIAAWAVEKGLLNG